MSTTFRLALLLLAAIAITATGCPRHQPPALQANLTEATHLRKAIGGDAVAATEAAALPDPTGWGTIRGRFRLSAPVSGTEFPIDKDTHVCGRTSPDLSVLLGPDNGLQNVLVYLNTKVPTTEEPWVHPDYAASETEEVIFDQKKCIFLSQVAVLRSSQKLRVLNSDPIGHNTSIREFAYNAIIPPGGVDTGASVKALSKPAQVTCSIHPWMLAYIIARPTPYFAVTDEAGNFEIKNVPSGIDLEFRVWQQRIDFVPGGVVNGSNVNWSKGRMKVKLEDGEELNLDVVLDAARFQ
jgi:hypothetical protein